MVGKREKVVGKRRREGAAVPAPIRCREQP